MAHCPREMLDDLAPVLAVVRRWPWIQERTLGVCYIKRTPFLHFHALRSGRVADARDGRDWGERIPLDHPISRTRQRAVLRELRRRYERTAEALGLAIDEAPRLRERSVGG